MPGTLIDDRWEVRTTRTIGDGGFGKVYKASDNKENPPVDCAAKQVSISSVLDRKAFAEELAVLRKVQDHESVIGLYGEAQQGATGWMFLEIATGGELFDRLIDSGSLSERASWPYMQALVQALVHCHARGVVHRDLKLENVMLCAEDPHAIRLIDFGLAVQLNMGTDGAPEPDQKLHDSAGTQAYRAPEVSTAGYEPTKVDVWGLGIILFSLSAGFFPLQEAKMSDWRFKRLAQDQTKGIGACESVYSMYKRKCPFSPALRELLDGMMQADPLKRWSLKQVAESEWLQKPQGTQDGEANSDDAPLYRGLSDEFEDSLPVDLPEDAVPLKRQHAVREPAAPA
jgi:serine/threonine protein kinase